MAENAAQTQTANAFAVADQRGQRLMNADVFTVTLRDTGGFHSADVRLKQATRLLAVAFGFRCVSVAATGSAGHPGTAAQDVGARDAG